MSSACACVCVAQSIVDLHFCRCYPNSKEDKNNTNPKEKYKPKGKTYIGFHSLRIYFFLPPFVSAFYFPWPLMKYEMLPSKVSNVTIASRIAYTAAAIRA